MRRKIVAGNWKMNLTKAEAIALVGKVSSDSSSAACDIVLFPSSVYLSDVLKEVEGKTIGIGAQNCSQYENGSYTGEVSASQLASMGIGYVIVGHSERREHFAETSAVLKEKLKLALKYDLNPIFCCGEPLQVRKDDGQYEYVLKQLQECLFEFTAEEFSKIIVAYEPIWAIGTGLCASAVQAQQMHSFIRQKFAARYTDTVAGQMRILYGGSVKSDNAKELFSCPDVDGGLVGGASLNAQDFLSIIEAAK